MWQEEDNKLKRTFKFKNFVEAFGFLTQVAILAEKMDHHPDISNTYNTVTLQLTTHDQGGVVTEKDRNLAEKIDKLV